MKIKFGTAICIVIIVILIIVLSIVSFFAYQNNKNIEQMEEQIHNLQQKNTELTNKNIELESNTLQEEPEEQLSEEESLEGNNDQKIDLSQVELAMFENYLNEYENNAFIVTDYSNVNEIDLNRVFHCTLYNIAEEENQAVRDEYKEVNGEIHDIPVWKYKKSKVDSFLQDKIGKTFSDITTRLADYKYSAKYDAFYNQYSDTENVKIKCTSGYITDGNKYVVNGSYEELMYKDNKKVQNFTVTLQSQGNNNYTFISNVMK